MAGEEKTVDIGEEATEPRHPNHTDHQGSARPLPLTLRDVWSPGSILQKSGVLWCVFYKDPFGCSAESKLKWGKEQVDQISLPHNKKVYSCGTNK